MENHHQTINHFAIITGNTLTYLKVGFFWSGFLTTNWNICCHCSPLVSDTFQPLVSGCSGLQKQSHATQPQRSTGKRFLLHKSSMVRGVVRKGRLRRSCHMLRYSVFDTLSDFFADSSVFSAQQSNVYGIMWIAGGGGRSSSGRRG